MIRSLCGERRQRRRSSPSCTMLGISLDGVRMNRWCWTLFHWPRGRRDTFCWESVPLPVPLCRHQKPLMRIKVASQCFKSSQVSFGQFTPKSSYSSCTSSNYTSRVDPQSKRERCRDMPPSGAKLAVEFSKNYPFLRDMSFTGAYWKSCSIEIL